MQETKANVLPPQLREQFDKARQAFERNNLDYAVTLLENVLKQAPACYEAREVLRATQVKRHDGKRGFFKKVLGTASSSSALAKAQIALRTQPIEALPLLESILSNDPNSVLAHKTMAQAALACDFPKTAVLSMEMAYRNQPKDKDTGIQLADALLAAANPRRAETIMKELAAEHRNDPEVLQALKNATAKRSLGEGGYEKIADGTGTYRDILKDEEEAVRLEDEEKGVKSDDSLGRLAAEYESKLTAQPDDPLTQRKLADTYREAGRLDEALALYQTLAESDQGKDHEIHRIIGEVKLAQFDLQVKALDPASDTYEAEYQGILNQKQAFAFETSQALVDRFPTEATLRLELGQHFLERGKYTEAIKEFQRAQTNPHIKAQAQKHLAQCFSQRGMLDLAERTLQSAIKEKEALDAEKKELIYELGVVQEKAEKPNEAIEQFKLIYEVDIDYRDVAEKVDQYYASQ